MLTYIEELYDKHKSNLLFLLLSLKQAKEWDEKNNPGMFDIQSTKFHHSKRNLVMDSIFKALSKMDSDFIYVVSAINAYGKELLDNTADNYRPVWKELNHINSYLEFDSRSELVKLVDVKPHITYERMLSVLSQLDDSFFDISF